MYYSYHDFIQHEEQLFKSNCIFLPKETINVIENLNNIIVIPFEDTNTDYSKKYDKMEKDENGFITKRKYTDRTKKINIDNTNTQNTWLNKPKLTPTQAFEKKEGIEKDINDVRICLNKISVKTFETHKENIITKISSCIDKIEDCDLLNNEDLLKISNAIFEIASTNKFMSELYAELYKILINKYEIFNVILNKFIDNFKNKINNTNYDIDESDFDKVSDFNKLNDKQKSTCLFIVSLVKKCVIKSEILLDFIDYYLKYITVLIDEENKISVVENITEYIFILIPKGDDKKLFKLSSGKSIFEENNQWNNVIVPTIVEFSKKKRTNHKSISSRVIFKFQEIVENL
jgi:DNA-binding CsgD family transcriptional regulator